MANELAPSNVVNVDFGLHYRDEQTGAEWVLAPNPKSPGSPASTQNNFCIVLENDPDISGTICYNEVAYRRWARGNLPWEPAPVDRAWTNGDEAFLRRWFEAKYQIRNKDMISDAVQMAECMKSINPIREKLDSLEWDGKDRLSTVLTEYLGVDPDDPFYVEALKVWMFGAIARAYTPGVKFDYSIVITGRQGIGKSTFLARMAMEKEWFSDGLQTMDASPEKVVEQLSGHWILELGELAAMRRTKDVNSIKLFLSKETDSYRVPYDKYPESRPRSCVFAGTTNSMSFLSDKSGNRRFLPIEAGTVQQAKSLFSDDCPRYFEQLWAQVLEMYRSGDYYLDLSPEMKISAAEHCDCWLEEDSREGIIQEWLDNTNEAIVCVPMLFEKALNQFGKPTKKDSNEIHEIMRRTVTGWKLHPNKNGKARCGSYGVQICYVRDNYHPIDEITSKLKEGELL